MKWSTSNQKIELSPVQVKTFRAELLTLSIWHVINTSCVWMAYFIPKREVRFFYADSEKNRCQASEVINGFQQIPHWPL